LLSEVIPNNTKKAIIDKPNTSLIFPFDSLFLNKGENVFGIIQLNKKQTNEASVKIINKFSIYFIVNNYYFNLGRF